MKNKLLRFTIATVVGGFSMWVVAGLWHNLVLPLVNENIEAHHEGLMIMLAAYLILSMFIVYFYIHTRNGKNHILEGLTIGALIGILWVFPHGLAMAGAHDTSIIYEIKNAIWHIVEQGIGGVIIALVLGK